MTHQPTSKALPAENPSAAESRAVPAIFAAPPGNVMNAWPEYMVDALQRSILFLDLLRQRGDEQIEITSSPLATVLSFGHEVLMDGRSLPRPMNYTLSRITPPPGIVIDPRKRPVVVIDPRAGQGPGVGGFKAESEIGDALNAGHPVYFIGFAATPVAGQQFLDVVEGQVSFFERVVELHPDAPRPFAIGNCQAGYQTLMVAILRPDLFGPCLVAGSPMSYWQGVHGKNPMRYAGGLLGGSWLVAMMSDLGAGKIDGTDLVVNFDILYPANWLWGKQYEVYTHVDSDAARYLKFEKWWGDLIQLNGDELQFLVDDLFIGDKLTRNQIRSRNGAIFDLRSVTSPIIVFTSMADNISPPPQTLGWILDLYRDVDDIRAFGRTIVYCVSQKVGHLAIFVSAKVGAKEDDAGDRRARRGADPSGAVCHRRRSYARPALRASVERCTPKTHASVARRVQSDGAGPVLCTPARARARDRTASVPCSGHGRPEGVVGAGARDRQRRRSSDRSRKPPPGPTLTAAGHGA